MSRAVSRLSWVFFVLFTLSHVLLGAEEKEAQPFTLKAGNGTVDVFRPDGSLLQSLPSGGRLREDSDPDSFAFVQDMDFDGSPDVGIFSTQGAQNIFYDCWLWREDAGAFVQYEGFSDVSSPGFDTERKRVTSFTHSSATDNVTAEYAWVDGRLVLMEETVQEYSWEGELFRILRHARGDDGEIRLIEEKTLSPGEMDALRNDSEETAELGIPHCTRPKAI